MVRGWGVKLTEAGKQRGSEREVVVVVGVVGVGGGLLSSRVRRQLNLLFLPAHVASQVENVSLIKG